MTSSTEYCGEDKRRWTAQSKAAVIEAVRKGTMSRPAVLQVYGLSPEELESWERLYGNNDVKALRATKLHIYRGSQPAGEHHGLEASRAKKGGSIKEPERDHRKNPSNGR